MNFLVDSLCSLSESQKDKARIEKRNYVTVITRNDIYSVFIVPCRKLQTGTALTTQTRESSRDDLEHS